MLRRFTFSFIVCCVLVICAFSQGQIRQSEADKSIDSLLATAVEDFTRGFIRGFDDSMEAQILAFEDQTNSSKELTASEKTEANTQFRKLFSATMERIRTRSLAELKIAETFKAKLAGYYRANYSEEELVKLVEFMSTPLGKKVSQNQAKYDRFVNDFSESLRTDERFLKIVTEETSRKVDTGIKSN